MNRDLENALRVFYAAFAKALPEKINELEKLWQELSTTWNEAKAIELRNRLHNLHGSAGIYGYYQLGQAAGDLFYYMKEFSGRPAETKEKQKITSSLQEIIVLAKANPVFNSRE